MNLCLHYRFYLSSLCDYTDYSSTVHHYQYFNTDKATHENDKEIFGIYLVKFQCSHNALQLS